MSYYELIALTNSQHISSSLSSCRGGRNRAVGTPPRRDHGRMAHSLLATCSTTRRRTPHCVPPKRRVGSQVGKAARQVRHRASTLDSSMTSIRHALRCHIRSPFHITSSLHAARSTWMRVPPALLAPVTHADIPISVAVSVSVSTYARQQSCRLHHPAGASLTSRDTRVRCPLASKVCQFKLATRRRLVASRAPSAAQQQRREEEAQQRNQLQLAVRQPRTQQTPAALVPLPFLPAQRVQRRR